MRPISVISIIVVGISFVQGCKRVREPVEAKVYAPKPVEQLQLDWAELESKVRNSAVLQQQLERFKKRHGIAEGMASTGDALKRAYGTLSDPSAKTSAAVDALQLFSELGTPEVVRQELLHDHWAVVGQAATIIVNQSERGVKDKGALPYLIYFMAKNNDARPGNGETTGVKERVLLAIQRITNLDIELSETDVDNPQKVEQSLSMARAWARHNSIRLFEE
jgi:hypothetical protein